MLHTDSHWRSFADPPLLILVICRFPTGALSKHLSAQLVWFLTGEGDRGPFRKELPTARDEEKGRAQGSQGATDTDPPTTHQTKQKEVLSRGDSGGQEGATLRSTTESEFPVKISAIPITMTVASCPCTSCLRAPYSPSRSTCLLSPPLWRNTENAVTVTQGSDTASVSL